MSVLNHDSSQTQQNTITENFRISRLGRHKLKRKLKITLI